MLRTFIYSHHKFSPQWTTAILTAKNAQVCPRVLEKGWTKSQQNNLTRLLFGFTGTLYMKIMYQYLPDGGAILGPMRC